MDDTRLSLLEQQVAEHRNILTQVATSQQKIERALIGSLDSETPGIITEHRQLKSQVQNLSVQCPIHASQIQELIEFKKEIKRIVAFIAFMIPFAFEVVKGLSGLLWEYIHKSNVIH